MTAIGQVCGYQRAGVQVPKGRGAATKMQGLGYQRAGVCLQKGKGVTPQGQGCDYCRGGGYQKGRGAATIGQRFG